MAPIRPLHTPAHAFLLRSVSLVNDEWKVSGRIERRRPENAALRANINAHNQSMIQLQEIKWGRTWMAWVYAICVAFAVLALVLAMAAPWLI